MALNRYPWGEIPSMVSIRKTSSGGVESQKHDLAVMLVTGTVAGVSEVITAGELGLATIDGAVASHEGGTDPTLDYTTVANQITLTSASGNITDYCVIVWGQRATAIENS